MAGATFDLQWRGLMPGLTVDQWIELELDRQNGISDERNATVHETRAPISEPGDDQYHNLTMDIDFDDDMEEVTASLPPTQPYGDDNLPQGDNLQDDAHSEEQGNGDDEYRNEDTEEQDNGTGQQQQGRVYSEIDVDSFISNQANKSTINKTRQHMKLLMEYFAHKGESRAVHQIPPHELDNLLASFFINVRKDSPTPPEPNSELNYEPCTLKAMQSSISRYLKDHHYEESIITSDIFHRSRQAIAAKCKELKKIGLGNKPQRKRAPSDDEMRQMWENKGLGDSSPKTLQHTMWWIMSTRFGMRANQENVDLRWGDVQANTDSNGLNYLVRNERNSKTRQGDNISEVRKEVRVFEDKETPEYCPVRLYNLYKEKRPESMRNPNSRFYLQPKTFSSEDSMKSEKVWFKTQVHGLNSIKKYMKLSCEKAGIDSVGLSNISARKHLVSTCRKSGVPDSTTMKVSGHKRVDSINSYADLANEENVALGKVLGRPTASHYVQSLMPAGRTDQKKTRATSSSTVPDASLFGKGAVFQNCTFNMK